MNWLTVQEPQPGDMAYHERGYDGRKVVSVTMHSVWLDIHGKACGPFPREYYTFLRPTPDPEEGIA